MNDEKALLIVEKLKAYYPDPRCGLTYGGDPWRLLVMARLSAQCTDKRVNIVSGPLFEAYPDVKAMADADQSDLEELIRPCGLHKGKARDIIGEAKMITEKFEGKIPDNMEDLLALPGVGRKIANLMLGDVFGKPAIVADTHCIRLSARMGFTPAGCKDPLKTEKILKGIIPEKEQNDFCHRLVDYGREVCKAQNPGCGGCMLKDLCENKEKDDE